MAKPAPPPAAEGEEEKRPPPPDPKKAPPKPIKCVRKVKHFLKCIHGSRWRCRRKRRR